MDIWNLGRRETVNKPPNISCNNSVLLPLPISLLSYLHLIHHRLEQYVHYLTLVVPSQLFRLLSLTLFLTRLPSPCSFNLCVLSISSAPSSCILDFAFSVPVVSPHLSSPSMSFHHGFKFPIHLPIRTSACNQSPQATYHGKVNTR